MPQKSGLLLLPAIVLTNLLMAQVRQDVRQTPQYRVNVNEVTVDVIVTDKKGGYLPDLHVKDFEIYEDGVRQEIQGFQWIHTDMPGTGAASPGVPKPERSPEKPLPRSNASSPPSAPRLFLLVIDNLNTRWTYLAQMEDAVESFISTKLQPQDLVAVSTVSRSLVMNFTNNREVLRTAVRMAFGRSTEGTASNSIVEQITDLMDVLDDAGALVDLGLLRTQLLVGHDDFAGTSALATVKGICRSLARIKGRKTLVFITEGFAPLTPVRNALVSVIDAANRANVSIYTINAIGIGPSDAKTLDALAKGITIRRGREVIAGADHFDLITLEAFLNLRDDSLTGLADSTGGLTFRRSNMFEKQLETIFSDSHSYYELTYAPKNQNLDGRFRRIKVRLASGVRRYAVRARRGYYAVDSLAPFRGTAEEQMAQALYNPELLDEIHSSIVPAVFLDPGGSSLARVSLLIDPAGMPLKKLGADYSASFRVLAAAFDDRGRIVSDYGQDYRLTFDEARYQEFLQVGSRLAMTFKLPPGKYQVKTVLRDIGTGKMSTVREDVEIVPQSPERPSVSSIVLSRSSVPYERPANAGETYDPFRMGDVVLVPSSARSYPREGFLTVFFHVYNVGDPGSTPCQYRLNLYRDEALYTSSDPRTVQSENPHPLNGYLLAPRLSLSNLVPGSYRLEVEVSRSDGQDRVTRSVQFWVN